MKAETPNSAFVRDAYVSARCASCGAPNADVGPVSLDGYIAPPDGKVDWLSAYNSGNEDYGYGEFYKSIDALVEGSRTYEQALGFGE